MALHEPVRDASSGPEVVSASGGADRWVTVLTASAGLSAIAASVVIAVAEVAFGHSQDLFVLYNNVEPEKRRLLLALVLVAISAPPVLAFLSFARRGEAVVPRLELLARLASPLALCWTLPALVNQRIASEKPVGYLLLLAVTGLGLERLLRLSLSSVPARWEVGAPSRRATSALARWAKRVAPLGLVSIGAVGYCAYMSYYSILEHHRFQTSGYDLGIYTSMLENFVAGHWFRSTILNPNISYLAHHAELGSLYLVPLYALAPRAETLLAFQSFALGFAAIPLYLFASTKLPRASAATLALAYLFFAPLHGPNFYDFHWMPLTIPVWFILFYGLSARRMGLVVAAALVVLPMRDEAGFFLGALGAYLIGTGWYPRLGFGFGVVGVAWTLFMRLVVTPAHGDAGFEGIYRPLIAPGEQGFGAVASTLLSNPNFVWTTLANEEKLVFVLHMLAPLVFLPARRVKYVWLLLPGSLFTLLTAGYSPTVSIAFQYTTHLVPWLFFCTVLAIRELADGAASPRACRRAAVGTCAVAVLVHSVTFGAFFRADAFRGGFHKVAFGITPEERARYEGFLSLQAEVPRRAWVAATDAQSPHFGAWTNICTLRITHCDAEYLFLWHQLTQEERRQVRDALSRDEYGLVDEKAGFYLFQRGHRSNRTEPALRELGLG
jgi:uncharacterized membrane protein